MRIEPALFVLEDGTVHEGTAYGARGSRLGEAVFSTGMTGYQETLTDPSYARQIIVQTAPHIGNTGINDEDLESRKIWVSGYVVRDAARRPSNWRSVRSLDEELTAQDVVGIKDVDTRAITRHLRDRGSMRAGIFSGEAASRSMAELVEEVRSQPEMKGARLAEEVTAESAYVVEPADHGWQGEPLASVAAIDLGLKNMTPVRMAERGLRVHVLPATTTFAEIEQLDADGVFLSNGPGDPATAATQIGLLRAVGASTGQVAGRLLTESVLLGLIGSLIGVGLGIGVGAIAGYFTKSLYWGLVLPFGELAVAVAAGVLATVLSMIGPLLTATRVSPLEALQVVPSAARAKRLSIVRAVFCGLFLLLGGGLVFQAFSDTEHGLMWAAGGGAFLSLAILGAAPFYIPLLLRLFGRIFGFAGPTVKLAASNAARNPRRASATAVALMLAVGLVVTLQVGVSTMRTSAIEWINQRYPVDVSARATSGPLPSGVVEGLRNSSGVAKVVEVSSKQVDLGGEQLSVRNVNPGYAELGLSGGRNDAADGVVTVSLATARAMPSRIELPGAGEVEVRGSNKVEGNTAAVSESVFEKLSGTAEVREAWVKLTDRNSVSAINQVMNVLRPYMTQAATGDGVVMGGGATAAGIIEQVVNVLMVVLTALLGVAVAIALIGVGNTLGLSVLERQRESALLRALGMQRRSLRLMLLTEAMFLALAGIVLGVAAGSFFAWLGVVTSLGMMSESSRPDVVFSVNLPVTGGLILVCVAAAALASVLPGRRAANATPTEALAVD